MVPFLVAIKRSFYIPKDDDVIWIFSGDACFVYQRINGKAKYIGVATTGLLRPRSHNTQSSSHFINDCILDHSFQTPKSRKNFRGTKNKNRKFRLIPLDQITIGCNQNGIPASRFIVPEESDPNLVKEYSKTREKYDCIQCRSSHKRVQGKIISNIFYAPEFHLNTCFPIERNFAEKRLEKIKEKTFKKHWEKQYSAPKNIQKSQKNVKNEATNSSPIEIITIESDEEEPYIDNQNFEEECACPPLNGMASQIIVADKEQQQTGQQEEELPPILQRIKFQNEYLAFLAQLNSENLDQNETIITSMAPFPSSQYFHEFNHPSTRWLKSACQKLNLIYHQNAYQFWAYMDIIYLTENSKPNQIQYVNDGKYSGFRALSFILSGHENYRVKNVIYKYFLENFHTLGFFGGNDFSTLTPESDIIKETIFADYFTPELWEIIAQWLECRIGIFIDDNLVKYGNWNNQENYVVIYKVTNPTNNEYTYVVRFVFKFCSKNEILIYPILSIAYFQNEEEKRLGYFDKYDSYEVPNNLKSFYISFKIDHNGIYSIKYISSSIIVISGNFVIIHDLQNGETKSYNAAVDYGFDEAIVDVTYDSVNVVNEPLKYFERECINDKICVKSFKLLNTIEICYVIKINGKDEHYSTKRVLSDILKYCINITQIKTDSCIVTYPPHFTELQKQAYIETFANCGLKNSIFVDEQVALAYGCENEFNLPLNTYYTIVHYSSPKICISLFKSGVEYDKEYERILLEAENIEASKNGLFDSIVDESDGNNPKQNDFEADLENCLLALTELHKRKIIHSIFVTRSTFLFSTISDHFLNTHFIQNHESLIARGAINCYDNPDDSL